MSSTASAHSPPDPRLVLFARGVIALLAVWPVLRLAVQESWGGPQSSQKRTWIASTIVDAFESAPLDDEQVEDILLDSMAEEFNTEIEDGSSLAVAKRIVSLWQKLADGRSEPIFELEASADRLSRCKLEYTREDGNGDDTWVDEEGSDDGDGDDGESVPALLDPKSLAEPKEPVIDEDGFQLVQKGCKHH
jgi:pre-rRNA-processing protein TSR2